MKTLPQTHRTKAKARVALLLTFSAGIIDIIAYLTLAHMFVAHMTGATVHLGNGLASARWADATKVASIIGSFILGSVIGRSLIEAGSRAAKPRIASLILLFETACVVAFVWVDRFVLHGIDAQQLSLVVNCALLALLAGAMGLQTAALTRIGPLTIHTTFVTGMLNKFAQAISEWIFWVHDEWRAHANLSNIVSRSREHSAFLNAGFMAAIWCSYMIGSVAGTVMNSRWSTRALYVPVFLLLVSVVFDQIWPLSIEEEKEQA